MATPSDVQRAEQFLLPADANNAGTGGTISSELDMLSEDLEQQSGAKTDENRNRTGQTETTRALGVSLDTSHLETYRDNLAAVRDAVRDTKQNSTKADFRPTGYALAVLAARYEGIMRSAVHELKLATPNDGDLNNVKNL